MNKITIEGLKYIRRAVWETSNEELDYNRQLSLEKVLHILRNTPVTLDKTELTLNTPREGVDIVVDILRFQTTGEVFLTKFSEPRFDCLH